MTHIALGLLIISSLHAQEGTGSISGTVTDARSGDRLAGANVLLKGTLNGAVTGTNSRFRIARVLAGRYTIQCSLVGYATKVESDVFVEGGKETVLTIALVPAPVQMDQVVVTASRRMQDVQDVPTSMAVVNAQTIVERGIVTVDDALRYVSGVNMSLDQVNIRGSSGYSRGVGSRVLMLIDGLPYLTGDTGEITWETIPVHEIERIEIVKGAGSALYGSSALGGVINIVTKGIPDERQVRYRLYGGAYDKPRYQDWRWSSRTRTQYGGFVGYSDRFGPVGISLSIARSQDDSYKQNDVYSRWSVYGKGLVTLSESEQLQITTNVMHRTHGNFFFWKSLSEATRPAKDQLNGNVVWNRGSVSSAYTNTVDKDFLFTLKGIYYGNFWQDDSSGRVNNTSSSHVGQLEAQATIAMGPVHIVTGGVVANYDRVISDLFGTHPGIGVAAYLQDEWALTEDLRLTTGVRFDWQKVSALAGNGQLNPKAGIVYRPGPQTSLRASVARGFRAPSISELYTSVNTGVSALLIVPNVALKAERSMSYEIGISHLLFGVIGADVAVFQNDFDDLIEAGVPSDTLVIRFDNVTRARIRGLEVTARGEWLDQTLSTEAGYTYTDPEDMSTNRVLKFRPRHLLYGAIGFHWGAVRASLDGRYVSRMEAIDENLVQLAPIVDGDARVPIRVVDLRLGANLSSVGLPFEVGLNVNNLFNYHYVEMIGNLSPVRTFVVSIQGSM